MQSKLPVFCRDTVMKVMLAAKFICCGVIGQACILVNAYKCVVLMQTQVLWRAGG